MIINKYLLIFMLFFSTYFTYTPLSLGFAQLSLGFAPLSLVKRNFPLIDIAYNRIKWKYYFSCYILMYLIDVALPILIYSYLKTMISDGLSYILLYDIMFLVINIISYYFDKYRNNISSIIDTQIEYNIENHFTTLGRETLYYQPNVVSVNANQSFRLYSQLLQLPYKYLVSITKIIIYTILIFHNSWTVGVLFCCYILFLQYINPLIVATNKNAKKLREVFDNNRYIYGHFYRQFVYNLIHGNRNTMLTTLSNVGVIDNITLAVEKNADNWINTATSICGGSYKLLLFIYVYTNQPVAYYTLLHYTSTQIQQINSFISDYQSFQDLSSQHIKITKFLTLCGTCPKYTIYKSPIQTLMIQELQHTLTSDDREPFTFGITNPLTFLAGEKILVNGASGHGKSSFYNVLSGISIPTKLTSYANDTYLQDGFLSLETQRVVVMQDVRLQTQFSWFEIVTDNVNISKPDIEYESLLPYGVPLLQSPVCDTNLVRQVLDIVNLGDVLRDQFKDNLNTQINNKLSGGQIAKLGLARSLFRVLTSNPSILILDEPDKGIPESEAVDIINKILKRATNCGCMVFLTSHLDVVKTKIKYDQILNVENGKITSLKN
jgi:ABC-type transport system involved in cytochrome bd biosynthesis fused ATPase/permease subunit